MTQQSNQQWKDWVNKAREFLQKPYGIAVVVAVVFAICVALGQQMSNAVFGHKDEADDTMEEISSAVEDDTDYQGGGEIDAEKFQGTVLEKTEDAGEQYIKDTLFVGDSNTVRYMSYGFASLDHAIGVISMSATQVTSLPCVKFKSNKDLVTINKAIPIMQPKRVVFSFGTNDLTGGVKSYISSYEKAIKKCYDAYPYFDVLVSAIPPVDQYRNYPAITMQNIDKFNAALVDMCEKKGWKFLNTSEVLKDKNTGFAKKDYTVYDGLHLSKEGVTVVFDYIRTHAYETKDRRPTPLKKVPERGETPPDLISHDPLKPDGPHPTATATATAAPETITVHFTSSEGGKINGELEQNVAIAGTCAVVEAVPEKGYVFKSWSCTNGRIEDTKNPKLHFTVPGNATEDITIKATFEKVEAKPTPTATPQPEKPAEQVKPVEPETPTQTAKPVETEKPAEPEKPIKPEKPSEPEKTAEPEKPSEPETVPPAPEKTPETVPPAPEPPAPEVSNPPAVEPDAPTDSGTAETTPAE